MVGPLVMIFTCLVVGLGLGALYMHRKLNVEIALLEEDVATAHQRLRELLGQCPGLALLRHCPHRWIS